MTVDRITAAIFAAAWAWTMMAIVVLALERDCGVRAAQTAPAVAEVAPEETYHAIEPTYLTIGPATDAEWAAMGAWNESVDAVLNTDRWIAPRPPTFVHGADCPCLKTDWSK